MSGTNRTLNPILGGPTIILVEPQLGENIGATARAMLNFGLVDLRLVRPRDGWPNDRATSSASGADQVMESVQIFDTTAQAIGDLNHVMAATARIRALPAHLELAVVQRLLEPGGGNQRRDIIPKRSS